MSRARRLAQSRDNCGVDERLTNTGCSGLFLVQALGDIPDISNRNGAFIIDIDTTWGKSDGPVSPKPCLAQTDGGAGHSAVTRLPYLPEQRILFATVRWQAMLPYSNLLLRENILDDR